MASDDEEAAIEAHKLWRQEQMRQLKIDSRFSLPFGMRLPLATTISFLVGMSLGVSHGAQTSGLRFRAENAHRLPTTPTGWYLYHKSKNYHMAFGGVIEGLKMGAKVSFWTAGFFGVEDIFDRWRGTKDFVNTVIASLTVAGGFSIWSMATFTPRILVWTDGYRSIPYSHSCEDGEKWTGNWAGIWIGTGCSWGFEGKKAGLCGVHPAQE
jgi:hypothetical protein